MGQSHSAGGYIESWCTKCKLELGHTIVALVNDIPKRVKCNTCNGLHNFKGKPMAKIRIKAVKKSASSRKPKTQEILSNLYTSRLMASDPSNAKVYSIKGNFRKDELIDHPKFGMGLVLSIIQMNKVEVFFKDGPRLLVQNK